VCDALRHELEGNAISDQVADLRRRIEMLERRDGGASGGGT
jgi:hypothetical protein